MPPPRLSAAAACAAACSLGCAWRRGGRAGRARVRGWGPHRRPRPRTRAPAAAALHGPCANPRPRPPAAIPLPHLVPRARLQLPRRAAVVPARPPRALRLGRRGRGVPQVVAQVLAERLGDRLGQAVALNKGARQVQGVVPRADLDLVGLAVADVDGGDQDEAPLLGRAVLGPGQRAGRAWERGCGGGGRARAAGVGAGARGARRARRAVTGRGVMSAAPLARRAAGRRVRRQSARPRMHTRRHTAAGASSPSWAQPAVAAMVVGGVPGTPPAAAVPCAGKGGARARVSDGCGWRAAAAAGTEERRGPRAGRGAAGRGGGGGGGGVAWARGSYCRAQGPHAGLAQRAARAARAAPLPRPPPRQAGLPRAENRPCRGPAAPRRRASGPAAGRDCFDRLAPRRPLSATFTHLRGATTLQRLPGAPRAVLHPAAGCFGGSAGADAT
jgi:hypothetical protein